MNLSELIEQSKQRNIEAFAGIYDLFAPMIFRYVKLKVQNRAEAEDLLQEVFLKAWEGLPSFQPERGSFRAWLYRIASNTVNDYFRRIYRKPTPVELKDYEEIAGGESVEEEVAVMSEVEGIKTALQALRPVYREVLELRFIQDLTVAETASVLGRSNLAVRLVQSRALKKLRRFLQEKQQMSDK